MAWSISGCPQATGTAHGASYDSKKNELTLRSAIDIQTGGREPEHIQALHGTITKEPRLLIMDSVQMTGGERKLLADHATVNLGEDNSVQHVYADGNVRVSNAGGMQVRSPRAEMTLGANNTVESALFSGGVDFESDQQAASGHSGEMLMHLPQAAAKKNAGKRAAGSATHRKARARRREAVRQRSCRPSMPGRASPCGRRRRRRARIRRRWR